MDIKKSFRPSKYLSNDQLVAMEEATDMFVSLADDMNELPESREKALCLTKLQEAKFWAIECICKNLQESGEDAVPD